ncbi:MAG: SOS response-associated peptidase [Blastocatellia bacterium]|nr:SOS response-associated peptidase [Blastocatellia bacterium]
MCGRFTLQHSTAEVAERFEVQEIAFQLTPRYNIAPSQQIAAIVAQTPTTRKLEQFKWGLVPSWAKEPTIGNRMINARAETLTEKASFKKAFIQRRCIIPADGFYEWTGEGRSRKPLYIQRIDRKLFGLAGLWEEWRAPDSSTLRSCTIITVEPNRFISAIHHRMAVILMPEDEAAWLNPDLNKTDELMKLLKPYPDDLLEAYPVSTRVNSPSVDDPECLQPVLSDKLFEI